MGAAGLLVPPRDPPALERALDRLLADPKARARLTREGPTQASRFSVTRMIEAYARLYEELLGR